MAITPDRDDTDPVVARAARELRGRPTDPRWIDISSAIVSSITAATRRTWPLDAAYPPEAATRSGDTLRISDHVIKTTLHRVLAGYHGAYLTRVDLGTDGHRCTSVHLTVTGVYGDVLPATGALLADLTVDVLNELFGIPIASVDVTVHIDDLDTTPRSSAGGP